MSVDHLEILVEEPSAEAAIRAFLPKLLGGLSFEVYPFQCKNDLLAQLPARLKGYSCWIPATWRILILVDRDQDDCMELKARMEAMATEAHLTTRSEASGLLYTVVNRIVIEELEAWYFGDWAAVRQAYPRAAATIPRKAKYRLPDGIAGGTWEHFEQIMKRAGYFRGGLRKIEAARQIAPYFDPAQNRSPSFNAMARVIAELVENRQTEQAELVTMPDQR